MATLIPVFLKIFFNFLINTLRDAQRPQNLQNFWNRLNDSLIMSKTVIEAEWGPKGLAKNVFVHNFVKYEPIYKIWKLLGPGGGQHPNLT